MTLVNSQTSNQRHRNKNSPPLSCPSFQCLLFNKLCFPNNSMTEDLEGLFDQVLTFLTLIFLNSELNFKLSGCFEKPFKLNLTNPVYAILFQQYVQYFLHAFKPALTFILKFLVVIILYHFYSKAPSLAMGRLMLMDHDTSWVT